MDPPPATKIPKELLLQRRSSNMELKDTDSTDDNIKAMNVDLALKE